VRVCIYLRHYNDLVVPLARTNEQESVIQNVGWRDSAIFFHDLVVQVQSLGINQSTNFACMPAYAQFVDLGGTLTPATATKNNNTLTSLTHSLLLEAI